MKLITTLLFLSLLFQFQGQTELFFEDFESGGASFSLNTSDAGSSPGGANTWVINNAYTGGTGDLICLGFPFSYTITNTATQPAGITNNPTSSYMHIASTEAITDNIFCSSFAAADGLCILNDFSFAAMNTDVNTMGYDDVTFNFWWNCGGGPSYYGEVYYSTNGGVSWTLITTPMSQYNNTSPWTEQNISLPAFANQATLRFGFRFVNNTGASAVDPGFSIDDVTIFGETAVSIPGCIDTTACNYDSAATEDDGSCAFPGCIDSTACNYDSSAGCTDGSCDYTSCAGCMDSTAWNYDSTATIDNGCCFYLDTDAICGPGTIWDEDLHQCVPFCSADFDQSGIVNTQDLLMFLVFFGQTCE